MHPETTYVTDTADIARVIAHADQLGVGHLAELLRPAMAGRLNVIMLRRDVVSVPLRQADRIGLPTVVVVGDDDFCPAGPDGWGTARKLRTWASFAVVHGTGAQGQHYAMAAELAQQRRRLLFVETTSAAAQQWAAFLHERKPRLPFMGVLPPDGVHPVVPDRAAAH